MARIGRLLYVCTASMSMLVLYRLYQNTQADRGNQDLSIRYALSNKQADDFFRALNSKQEEQTRTQAESSREAKSEQPVDDTEEQHITDKRTPMSNDSELLSILETFKQNKKPALVTVINDAYMPFAHSWLCNTMYMNIHEQVLVIATDEKSRDEIAATWPKIQVVAMGGEGFHGNQDYSHAGYVRIMVKRTELILQILEQKVEMLLFDLDTFWRTDPMPSLMKSVEGHDIAAVPVSNQRSVVCGGFIYMKPTESMIKLWRKLTDMMRDVDKMIKSKRDDKKVPEGQNDQVFVSSLLRKKYAGIKLALLSLKDYPDGLWYGQKEENRALPYLVVHNNWIIGNKAKINRAKKFHQWFWDSNNTRCDTDLVKQQTLTL